MATLAKPTILCVDDEVLNLHLYKEILRRADYDVDVAGDGMTAMDKLREQPYNLVILDLMMHPVDGLHTLEMIRKEPGCEKIPVIIATSYNDRTLRLKALQTGANEILLKPVDQAELLLRVNNLLKIKQYQDLILGYNTQLEASVSAKTHQLKTAYIETIRRLMIACEYRDEDTADHIMRISLYARALAEHMGLSQECCESVYYTSPMHDIGKIGIPDTILNSNAALSHQELLVMRTHTVIGARILDGSGTAILNKAREIALCHHERWDGSGYPHGLSGTRIPLEARIVALADIYDALRMRRPYKPAFSHERAVDILCNGDGRTSVGHFDPECHRAFRELTDTFDEIFEGRYKAPWNREEDALYTQALPIQFHLSDDCFIAGLA